MNGTGGYFELELKNGNEYHTQAIRLNTGRNALQYILEVQAYIKIYLPYYGCDVLLQPVNTLNILYEYYHINENFEPVFDFVKVKENEVFLYTNYFGLKDNYVLALVKNCKNVIIDNAQSFFSKPVPSVNTFYSARKFFGVPDGAYCYTSKLLKRKLEQDFSFSRCEHLLRRIDENAESGYPFFKGVEENLDNQTIKHMSHLTQRMLQSIDYEEVEAKRIENFHYLHNNLRHINELKLGYTNVKGALSYPFLTYKSELKKILIANKIYTPEYWLGVTENSAASVVEHHYATQLIHFPIDQRYSITDLKKIIKIISNEY
jgi:hypothetical protein